MARLDGPGGVGGRGWLRMRDGRSKTALIINHRMIHSIVPSPSVRSSVPPQNQIPERKLELSRKRSPLLPGESLPRPCEGGNLSPLEPSPSSRSLTLPSALSRMPETLHLLHRKPSHTSTYTPEPATAFILVRSFVLPLHDAAADSADLARGKLYFSTTFFPRHRAAPRRVDPSSWPHGLSIFEKL